MCLTDHPDESRPVPEARGLRPEAVRTAAPRLRRRLARDVRQVRPDSEPQDRHEQPRPVQHRQHRLQLRLSRGVATSGAARSSQEHERYQQGLALLHRQRSARAGGRADRDAPVGPAEGRVHRQRQLAAPDLRPRSAAHGRRRIVMTENELLKKRPTPDSVGMGSYTHRLAQHAALHHARRLRAERRATSASRPTGPYEIAYGSLVPKSGQGDNLLVPVCLSSSHIAFGSIRMEPVFMILANRRPRPPCWRSTPAWPCRTCRTRRCASGCWTTARCWSTRRPTGRRN